MRKSLLFLALVAWTAFAARPPFTIAEMRAWRSIREARISPDGQSVLYNECSGDACNLWVASADGRSRRPFTEGARRDASPRWSVDSTRVAWLSARDGVQRIRVRKIESGPETQIDTGEWSPLSLAWSPDAQAMAFTAAVPAPEDPPAWAPPEILPHLVRRDPVLQVFIASIRGGPPRRLTGAAFHVVGEPAWMADGSTILAARDDGQIYAFAASGGEPRQLTNQPGNNECPLPSPDGSRIAWLARAPATGTYATRKLWVMHPDGSRAKPLSGGLDRDASDPQWSSDSRTVYFLADDHGATHVHAARADGTLRQVTRGPERLNGFSLADNGRAVGVRTTGTQADEVYSFTVDRISEPVSLAAPNEHVMAEHEIAPAEEMHYDSAGHDIQAWVLKPPAADPPGKYPLLVYVPEGPRRMCGAEFNLRRQIAAARGFVVLCANPRGTPGYGEVFGNLLGSAGTQESYDDLMAAVDHMVAKGYIDPARLAIAGGTLAASTVARAGRFRRAALWSPEEAAERSTTPAVVFAADTDAAAQAHYRSLERRHVESYLIRLPVEPWTAWETALNWLAGR